MYFALDVLAKRPIDFQQEFPPGGIDLGPDFRQRDVLKASGRATLIEEHQGRKDVIRDIRVVGDFATVVEANCARCLEPVSSEVARPFDLLYRPQGSDAGRSELSVTQAEAEISYYQGDGLLLEDVLREQILLAVPLKLLCREDCKGLCSSCGRNLNSESCNCASTTTDLRWEALKKLRDLSS